MRRWIWLLVVSLAGGVLTALVAVGLHPHTPILGVAPPPSGPLDDPPVPSCQVVINELAWMGTQAGYSHEWIELYNATASPVDLLDWSIYGADTGNCLNFSDADGFVTTTLPAHGYLIYANHRDDLRDAAGLSLVDVWDRSIALNNSSPGQLILYDAPDCSGTAVDVVNQAIGDWFAGDNVDKRTMERRYPASAGTDRANWATNDPAVARCGYDAAGHPISGTPKALNAAYQPPPVPVADLSVDKRGPPSVRPGHPITYRLTLSNTGAASASRTVLTDALPTAVTFLTQTSPFTLSKAGHHLIWWLGDVPAGATHRITVTAWVGDAASGILTNRVTATTAASETVVLDNAALSTATLKPPHAVLLPLLVQGYEPPRYGVIIEALLCDGLQTHDYDEAVLIINGGHQTVDLTSWQLCKRGVQDWTCADLPAVAIGPRQRLWLARSQVYFNRSFGFDPDHVLSSWPRFANAGDEVALRDPDGLQSDLFVYGSGLTDLAGWQGPALQPYAGANLAREGQILYRRLDEETGLPLQDTDAAVDWAQHTGEVPWHGRRVRYPGWDLEPFFHPAVGVSGAVTAAIAPDNAYDLLVGAIRSAQETIELEAYTLEHPGIVSELTQRARQGVSVTVLLEGAPVGGLQDQERWACQQLHATGFGTCAFMINDDQNHVYDRYTYLHAKVMIVDRRRLLLGSQNLSPSGLPGDDKANGTGGSRGVVLLTDAPEMVARAVEIFQADCDPAHHLDVTLWPDEDLGLGPPPAGFAPEPAPDWVTYTVQFSDTVTAPGTHFELVTAPEAALRAGDALLGLVGRAGPGDAIYVEQLYEHLTWSDAALNPRLHAYLQAARRGARVRLLLNGGTFDLDHLPLTHNIETAAHVNEIAQLEGLDLSAHLADPTQYGIHNKMVLVDLGAEGKVAHVGSINGSETSSKVNREMALQVRSAALFDYLYALFEHDWRHQPPERHVLISEVLVNPRSLDTGKEWVELYNPTTADVDLSGWYVGDVGPGGEYGSGLYRFPAGSTLVAEGVILVAQQAADVPFTPDYEVLIDPHRDDPAVPNLLPAGAWDGFGLALGNGGDEVLLLGADGAPVDVVTWGDGAYPGVVPHPGGLDQGHSLERRPPHADTDDCSYDFFDRYPPTPGELLE